MVDILKSIERAWTQIARRRFLSCVLIVALALIVRLAILPVDPKPEPRYHDEFAYIFGGETFAMGRLANPTPPLWRFFETYYINMQPTYVSKYPPAQSAFLALGIRLFGHPWYGVLISIALMCGCICWMLQGWLPPKYALLGGLFAVLQFGDPGRPWEGALYMTAAALAVATPSYQWYSLLLVMLVALDGRPEWLAFAAGGYYAAEPSIGRYTVPYRLHLAVAYGVPVLVVAAGWLVRRALAGRGLGVTRRGFGIAGTAPVLASPAVTAAPDAAASIAVTPDAVAPALAEARPVAGLAGASPVAGLAGARPVAGFAEARSVAGLAAPDDSFDAFSPRPVPAGEPRDVRVEAARR